MATLSKKDLESLSAKQALLLFENLYQHCTKRGLIAGQYYTKEHAKQNGWLSPKFRKAFGGTDGVMEEIQDVMEFMNQFIMEHLEYRM